MSEICSDSAAAKKFCPQHHEADNGRWSRDDMTQFRTEVGLIGR